MSSRHSLASDLYKILNVSREATTDEIKIAYRKLALAFHPDRHDGDEAKTRAFKEASEAYNVLTNAHLRREYDLSIGQTPSGWYNRNRRRPPPTNYRKVYAPHAPPDGKWHDAQRHYDMHYGDGMFREAVKNAYERAKAAGEFDYHSPLGKGFTFERDHTRTTTTNSTSSRNNNNNNNENHRHSSYYQNPFSKAEQGPPSILYHYEETVINEAKQLLKRREHVTTKLHKRRQERLDNDEATAKAATLLYPGQKTYQPLNQQGDTACAIM